MAKYLSYVLVILNITFYTTGVYYSFQNDILAKINFINGQNLNHFQDISFVDKTGYRNSIDLLDLDKEKNEGLFLIPLKIFDDVKTFLIMKNFTFSIQKNRLDDKIMAERKINRKQYIRSVLQRTSSSRISYYMRYEEIKRWLQEKVRESYFMHVETLGYTEENRDMLLVKIFKNKDRPIIWVDAGIHAREWISPSTALFLIDKLLGDSQRAKILLEKYQFYIMPLINPDGYEYTHTINRLWRKNRSKTYFKECLGVDLNRNFPYQWGGPGSSNDPCSKVYRGEHSESEKETAAMISKLITIKSNVHLFITLHSFGQYIMTPFGYSRNRFPRQFYKLIEMASKVSVHIRENYGRTYQIGSSANLLYEASGASDDYAAGELRIPFTYTIELPDRGRYGFILPPTYIKSVGNQFWDGLWEFTVELVQILKRV